MHFDDFLTRLKGVTGSNGQYSARCPAHDDTRASLSVSQGEDGKILLHCHANCTIEQILGEMELVPADLFPPVGAARDFAGTVSPRVPPSPITATYDYHSADGEVIAQKLRRADKSFIWRHKGPNGWVYHKPKQTIPPYNLPAVVAAGCVFVAEGEKDVETLRAHGLTATTGADGAGKGKWREHYNDWFKGKAVIIIQDNDAVGKAYAAETADSLHGTAKSIKVLDLTAVYPELPEHGDVTDLLELAGADEGRRMLGALVSDTPEYEPGDKPTGKPRIVTISAPDLQKADLPPTQYLVKGFLPEGSGLISAASKVGKSWMVLDMGLSIAAGKPFMGHETVKCGVLYLALEDSLSRLQDRMNKILKGEPAPPLFHFTTEAPTLDNGLLDALDDHFKAHPETKLVIIDTLQKIRGQAIGRETQYAQDYRETGQIKKFMDDRGKSVFFVHHNRKMKDDDDPFNMISGTNGIMGAVDTSMVLMKQKRSDKTAVLSITGRDIPEKNTEVSFNVEQWRWEALGDADLLAEQRARLEYQNSPIVKTIKKLLGQSPEGRWSGTATELLDAGKYIAQTYLAPTATKLGHALKPLDKPLFEYDNIIHSATGNGNAGKKHHFYFADIPQLAEPDEKQLEMS